MARTKSKKTAPKATDDTAQLRVVADNRKAHFDYALLERIEAGLVLTGTEIKSVRAGRVNVREAYAQIKDGEAWLLNLHIAHWPGGGPWNHEPLRARKLLLHRDQIRRLAGRVAQKGLTLVPVRVYIRDHHAKVEVALGQGKRQYDKRRTVIQRETQREMARAIRNRV